MGCRDEAAAALAWWLDEQGRGGLLGADPTETAATLWALGVWAATGPDDGQLLAGAPLAVARAAELIGRAGRGRSAGALARVWAVAGLHAAATTLARTGEEAAGRRVEEWAAAAELGLSLDGGLSPTGAGGGNARA
ncbi:MAG TPA: hypothetical protein VGG23_08630 [Acidimicrobiales bacterium]